MCAVSECVCVFVFVCVRVRACVEVCKLCVLISLWCLQVEACRRQGLAAEEFIFRHPESFEEPNVSPEIVQLRSFICMVHDVRMSMCADNDTLTANASCIFTVPIDNTEYQKRKTDMIE